MRTTREDYVPPQLIGITKTPFTFMLESPSEDCLKGARMSDMFDLTGKVALITGQLLCIDGGWTAI